MYSLEIRSHVEEDVEAARDYYNAQSPYLGERFYGEVLDRFEDLIYNPEYYSFTDGKNIFRQVRLCSFPYVVFYEVVDDKVIVYSVTSTHQHPSKRFGKPLHS